MNGYVLLMPREIICTGDEWRTDFQSSWSEQHGWSGKEVRELTRIVGSTGRMRRKIKKSLIPYWK